MTADEIRILLKNGNIDEAINALRKELSQQPNNIQLIKLLANIYYKNKLYKKAKELYQHALSINSLDLESLFALGDMMIESDPHQATKILKTATGLCHPNSPQQRIIYLKLTKALRGAKKYKEGISFCKKLLKRDPNDYRALNAIGQLYQLTDKRVQAIESFEKLLKIKPDLPQALHNLAELYKTDEDTVEQAEQYFEKAISLKPKWDAPKRGLTACLMSRGAFQDAKKQLIGLVRLSPHDKENHKSLAQWYMSQGDQKIALTHYEDALRIDPKDTDTIKAIAMCYMKQGSDELALDHLEKALAIEEEAGTLNSIANIYKKQKDYDRAIEYLNRSYELEPKKYATTYFLSECYASTIRWDNRDTQDEKQIQCIKNHIQEEKQIEDLPLLIFNYYDIPINIHRDMAVFTSTHQIKSNQTFIKNVKCQHVINKSELLNVGYLSPDFRDHPVGRLMAPLFEHHDRNQVNVYGYALTIADQRDPYRQRIKSGCDQFRDLSTSSIEKSIAQIQADQIDILIDLAGHTAHNRPAIYMCKPAPISCHLMGFPGTVGADYHDYIIGDDVLTPFELSDYYSESIIQIPNSFIGPYQQIEPNIPTRKDLGLPEEKFIYAAFNRPGKIEPAVFWSWMKILQATPQSVLLLSHVKDDIKKRFRSYGADAGVDPERILFSQHLPYSRYLQSHRLLDLFLDTWHYSAGSTLIAALSSGLPALSVIDDTNASRMGACIIHGVGHQELIASSLSSYEAKAIELYYDRDYLARLKEDLINNGAKKDLFNYQKYAVNLEKAYHNIYRNYLNGHGAENIKII